MAAADPGFLERGFVCTDRKPFRRNDVWSNATFGRYDISSTMAIGRKFADLRQNLVENRLVQKKMFTCFEWKKTAIHAYNDMTISTDCRT